MLRHATAEVPQHEEPEQDDPHSPRQVTPARRNRRLARIDVSIDADAVEHEAWAHARRIDLSGFCSDC
jgi:hypothetical protein